MNSLAWLLAQTSNPAAPTTGQAPPAGGDPFGLLIPMMLALGAFYFVMLRGQRKDRQKIQSMLENLKANDRVETIGGMEGRVVRVDAENNRVQLQVDENSNVRVWFNRAAVKTVKTQGGEDASK